MLAGAGTDVDDPVRGFDRLLIVFDDDEGVPQLLELRERLDESAVVPLVQTDRGLVEDVEDPDEPRTDLRGQADALGFAAGQGARGRLRLR